MSLRVKEREREREKMMMMMNALRRSGHLMSGSRRAAAFSNVVMESKFCLFYDYVRFLRSK